MDQGIHLLSLKSDVLLDEGRELATTYDLMYATESTNIGVGRPCLQH